MKDNKKQTEAAKLNRAIRRQLSPLLKLCTSDQAIDARFWTTRYLLQNAAKLRHLSGAFGTTVITASHHKGTTYNTLAHKVVRISIPNMFEKIGDRNSTVSELLTELKIVKAMKGVSGCVQFVAAEIIQGPLPEIFGLGRENWVRTGEFRNSVSKHGRAAWTQIFLVTSMSYAGETLRKTVLNERGERDVGTVQDIRAAAAGLLGTVAALSAAENDREFVVSPHL